MRLGVGAEWLRGWILQQMVHLPLLYMLIICTEMTVERIMCTVASMQSMVLVIARDSWRSAILVIPECPEVKWCSVQPDVLPAFAKL